MFSTNGAQRKVKALVLIALVCLMAIASHELIFPSARTSSFLIRSLGAIRNIDLPDWAIIIIISGLIGSFFLPNTGRTKGFRLTPVLTSANPSFRSIILLLGAPLVLYISVVVNELKLTALNRLLIWITVICAFGWIVGVGTVTSQRNNKFSWSKFVFQSLLLCVLHLILWVPGLSSWRLALIGDEYGFYAMAKQMISDRYIDLFSPQGHFNFPVMGSIFQGLVLKLTSDAVVGFRFSGLFAVTLTIPAVILIFSFLFNQRYAWWAGFFLALDPLASSLGSIGYNNSQMLVVNLWAIALSLTAVYLNSSRQAYFAGVMAALGWYTVYTGMMAVIIAMPLLLLLSYLLGGVNRNLVQDKLSLLLPYLIGFIVVAGPMLCSVDQQLKNVLFRAPASFDIGHSCSSAFTTIVSPVFFTAYSHNLVGRIYLPVVSVLYVLGFFTCVKNIFRISSCYWLLTYLAAIVAVGVINPYEDPSVTRIMLLPPWISIFSGYAIFSLHSLLCAFMGYRRECTRCFTFVVILFSIIDFRVFRERDCQSFSYLSIAHVVRIGQRNSSGVVHYVYPDNWHQEESSYVLGLYNLQQRVVAMNESRFGRALDQFSPKINDLLLIHHDVFVKNKIMKMVQERCNSAGADINSLYEIKSRDGILRVITFGSVARTQWDPLVLEGCD